MIRWRHDVRLLLLLLCSCLIPCCCFYVADGAALQSEVDIVAQFFKATGFRNTTAVTTENLCSGWPAMLVCDSDRVLTLSFEATNLAGTIPTCLSGLSFLRALTLSRNQLSGSIPSDLCRNNGNLMNIQMSGNRIVDVSIDEYF